jgi:phosphoribosyl-ATP pyrophosphohydrolase
VIAQEDADDPEPVGFTMNAFEEFQALATRLPLSLRNNLDRINLPASGLQEEAGKIGSMLAQASASGRFALTPEHRNMHHDRLSDLLWHTALICSETGIGVQDVASHCIEQLQKRAMQLDPDQQ